MPSIQGFIGGDNAGYSKQAAYAVCKNLYAEPAQDKTNTTDGLLIGTPGTKVIPDWDVSGSVEVGDQGRGCYTTSRGMLYSVVGVNVFKHTDTGNIIVYKVANSGELTFADNGLSLAICDSFSLHIIDMYQDTGSTVQLPNGIRPSHVIFNSGRLIVNCSVYTGDPVQGVAPPDTLLYYSALYDATKWLSDGAGSTSAMVSSDPCLAIASINDQIIALGPRTVEFISPNADSLTRPFQRAQGSSTSNGIFAPYSLTVIGRSAYWLGVESNGSVQVYRTKGYEIETISTPSIEYLFTTNSNLAPSDAIGGTYAMAGHVFYTLTSKWLDITLVFDTTTGLWHRRTTVEDGIEHHWRPLFFASSFGKTYCMQRDYQGLLDLDLNTYAEHDGRYIIRERSTVIVQNELQGIVHSKVVLLMETGVGDSLSSNPDIRNPLASLAWSDDANSNYTTEATEPIGSDAQSGQRVVWYRTGYARQRSYRIRISAPVKVVLLDLYVNNITTNR